MERNRSLTAEDRQKVLNRGVVGVGGKHMERWTPRVELSKREQLIMKRLKRVRALFSFLRLNRHILFDEAFQLQLEGMYRQTGAGDTPHPPAMLCMVLLLQGYVGASDAEAVEMAVMDLRWQMVLDCFGAEEPPFSQGALQAFRERLVEHEMDRVLLERTVELVRNGVVGKSDGQMISKALRVAVDSRPLVGAGRVEDTINLLGHAARSIVRIVSKIMNRTPEDICRKAGIPLLLAPSIKAGLDIDWSDPRQKVRRSKSSSDRFLHCKLGWNAISTTTKTSHFGPTSRPSRSCAIRISNAMRLAP
jgi:hypothetical protein